MKQKDMKSSEETKQAEQNQREQQAKEQQAEEKNQAETPASEETTEVSEEAAETSENEQLKTELEQQKDKYLRLYSDFENFRRRTAKERLELHKTASEDVLKDLLPVIDDLERALKAMENQQGAESLVEGVDLVYQKFIKTLTQKGLEPMKTEKGSDFDPDFHEAITQIPVQEEELKGKIVDVIEKGYLLGEKVIRFAKVVTGA
jgi:molecular chaperone GrpE